MLIPVRREIGIGQSLIALKGGDEIGVSNFTIAHLTQAIDAVGAAEIASASM